MATFQASYVHIQERHSESGLSSPILIAARGTSNCSHFSSSRGIYSFRSQAMAAHNRLPQNIQLASSWAGANKQGNGKAEGHSASQQLSLLRSTHMLLARGNGDTIYSLDQINPEAPTISPCPHEHILSLLTVHPVLHVHQHHVVFCST